MNAPTLKTLPIESGIYDNLTATLRYLPDIIAQFQQAGPDHACAAQRADDALTALQTLYERDLARAKPIATRPFTIGGRDKEWRDRAHSSDRNYGGGHE
jgi:hypothetical protein